MITVLYATFITLICLYLGIRVYKLRKALKEIREHLAEIERKIPLLKP